MTKKFLTIASAVLAVLLILMVLTVIILENSHSKPETPGMLGSTSSLQNQNTDSTGTTETQGATVGTQPSFPTAAPTDPSVPQETEPSVPVGPAEPENTEFWKEIPADRQLLAMQYFVYDCQQEAFLILSGSEDERAYPASITKLFTAYLALQYLEPDQKIVAKEALELVGPGSSVAKIKWGDVLTVEQLIEGMILPSGNDAAAILAVEAGRVMGGMPNENAADAAKRFVAGMNALAADLGMTGTNFMNPDGLDDKNHYSTVADMVIIGKLALECDIIMKYVTVSKDKTMVFTMIGGTEIAAQM